MAVKSRISLDEFLQLPETEPSSELIDGEVCQKPVPTYRHGLAQTLLAVQLHTNPATANGKTITELGVRFPRVPRGNLRVPDVAYYLPENAPPISESYPDQAPDLVAEVRSPGQSLQMLRNRLQFLRDRGSTCSLLIDPERLVIEWVDGDASGEATAADEVVLPSLNGCRFKARDILPA